VADPGCMLIPDPDCFPSRIPDPTTPKERRGESSVVLLFCSNTFHKFSIISFINKRRTKLKPIFNLPIKLVLSSQKYCFGDLGDKKLFPDADPVV
jgi:hypothetical protein